MLALKAPLCTTALLLLTACPRVVGTGVGIAADSCTDLRLAISLFKSVPQLGKPFPVHVSLCNCTPNTYYVASGWQPRFIVQAPSGQHLRYADSVVMAVPPKWADFRQLAKGTCMEKDVAVTEFLKAQDPGIYKITARLEGWEMREYMCLMAHGQRALPEPLSETDVDVDVSFWKGSVESTQLQVIVDRDVH